MKLESYWLFKEILLIFSYIFVVSRGYILLISICPILNAGKLHIIASCAILAILFENYLKGAKIWWLFAQLYKNCTEILCWKSRQLTLWVDFKIESVLQAKKKKIKFYIHLANEEMGAATVYSQ